MEIRRPQLALMVSSSLLAGALSVLTCYGQASPASQSAGKPAAPSAQSTKAVSAETVVLKVGDTKVTRADIDYLIGGLNPRTQQAIAAQGRKPVGDEYAMMVLLSKKAESEHLDTSPSFQRRIALERLQILAQEEYQKIAENVQVSPGEVSAYFNTHKSDFPEEAKIHEFVIRKKAAGAKPGDPGLIDAEAKARLAEIQKALEAGTDLSAVAKKYDVPNTVMVNPEVVTVRKGEMLPELDKAAFDLQPNQFSAPIDTPQAVVLFQMVSRQQPDLKTVTPQIQDTLRQQKLKAALDDIKAKASIWMDPEYFKSPASAPEPGAGDASSAAPNKAPGHP